MIHDNKSETENEKWITNIRHKYTWAKTWIQI